MKSERAKKYIDNDTIEFRNGDRMVDVSTAYTAIEIAEKELSSDFMATLKKVHYTFMDLVAVFPPMKNEPLFAEVKSLIKKYENEKVGIDISHQKVEE